MQYVPSIPRYRAEIGVTEVPESTSAVQPVKRVVPRRLPPLIYQYRQTARQAETNNEAEGENLIERRRQVEERRQICRRVRQVPATLDTRSGHDRRHSTWRKEDHLDSSVDIRA